MGRKRAAAGTFGAIGSRMIENDGSKGAHNLDGGGLDAGFLIGEELLIGSLVDGRSVGLKPLETEVGEHLARGLSAISPWRDYDLGSEHLASFLGRGEPGAQRYAIFVGGAVAGAAIIWPNWLRGPYLQFLGLLDSHQGLGVGACVLGWLEKTARQRATNRNVWIMVSDFNIRARAFYRRQGYEEVAPIPDVVKDGMGEVLIRKRLR